MLLKACFYVCLLTDVSHCFVSHFSYRKSVLVRFVGDETSSSKFDHTVPTTATDENDLKSDQSANQLDVLGNLNKADSGVDDIVDNLVDTFLEESSPSSHHHDGAIPISAQNLSILPEDILSKVNATLSDIELAPHLTFEKYITMQGKRVNVTIRFSQVPGLRPYFLTIARKIKQKYPDIIIEKNVIPIGEDDSKKREDIVFDVLVDGKPVVGKSNTKWHHVRRSGKEDIKNNKVYGMSIYLSMGDIDAAIAKARKKRRPSTAYSDEIKSVGLQLLREKRDRDLL